MVEVSPKQEVKDFQKQEVGDYPIPRWKRSLQNRR